MAASYGLGHASQAALSASRPLPCFENEFEAHHPILATYEEVSPRTREQVECNKPAKSTLRAAHATARRPRLR